MTDHIYLTNMEFDCHIGAGDGERADLQTIEMDVEGDDLEKTADYGAVFELCRHVAEDHTYHLLEGLAEHVAHEILKKQPLVQGVAVTVRKPGVPIEGVLDHAGVRVERSRP
jgi:dihydroneopterin aldolase